MDFIDLLKHTYFVDLDLSYSVSLIVRHKLAFFSTVIVPKSRNDCVGGRKVSAALHVTRKHYGGQTVN